MAVDTNAIASRTLSTRRLRRGKEERINMRVYQIEARGFIACLNGSPHVIVSKEIYTYPPGNSEREAFKQKCIGGHGLRDLDPKKDILIRIIQYDLIDNGNVFATTREKE